MCIRDRYITNLITDDAIDWMENKRDKDKPFCILIHHKAIHPDPADADDEHPQRRCTRYQQR